MKNFILFLVAALMSFISMAQPVITQNPNSQTVCIDTCAWLVVGASGNGLSYQWQLDGGSGFADIANSGNNYSSVNDTFLYCPASVTDSIDLMFRCIVTDANGFKDSTSVASVKVDSCLPPKASFTFEVYGDSVCFTNTSLRSDNVLWNFGDGEQSTMDDPCHDFNAYLIFYTKLYAYNAYGVDEVEIEVSTLGLSELQSAVAWKVYPNPTEGATRIQSTEPLGLVEIIDLTGKVVTTLNLMNSKSIDLNMGLAAGMYFIRTSIQDTPITQKIQITE